LWEWILTRAKPKKIHTIFFCGDILNPADVLKAAFGTDIIIHLAARHHDFGISREEFFRVNVGGMKNILVCAAKLSIKKFIFYSTVAVYGNHKAHTTEATNPNPANNYGKSKLAAERLLEKWVAEDSFRQAAIIRPTVVFGPENYANMYNLINTIYKRRFIFVGKGENIKSVAYVENLVDATIFLLTRLKPGIDIYNYSDYPQMSTAQIVKTITDYLPCGTPKVKIPIKPAIMAASIFDLLGRLTGYNFPITANRIKKFNTPTIHRSDKIRALGFESPINSEEAFRKTVEWYLDNGNPDNVK
jgi:nucleoside-diphosphate-sugar epimerase